MTEAGLAAAGGTSDARAGCGPVLGLRIPADLGQPVSLAVLPLTASALSEAIGGGLLEDALIGESKGSGYTFLDEHRAAQGLPPNGREAVLAARLGHVNRAWPADLRGDVLVLGCDGRLDDVSVPRFVVKAAARSGRTVQRCLRSAVLAGVAVSGGARGER
jgi:hypothetical protein